MPGPQSEGYFTKADITFYGGGAGGGKTDLAIGLALTAHHNSLILRRAYPQIKDIIRRARKLAQEVAYNGVDKVLHTNDGRMVEFGSLIHENKIKDYQGRPHDLLVFDEITHFTYEMFSTLIGWVRSTNIHQRSRILCTGNPPLDDEGQWVIEFWAPWLDPTYEGKRAEPGELRWFIQREERYEEVEDDTPQIVNGKLVKPLSRTFIPSLVQDNPYYHGTSYETVLQNMPPRLRDRLLYGRFNVTQVDHPAQLITTEWITEAQKRWTAAAGQGIPLNQVGVDVARGGEDHTVFVPVRASWVGEPVTHPGIETRNGQEVLERLIPWLKRECRHGEDPKQVQLNVDVIGVGSSVYDQLIMNGFNAVAVNSSAGTQQYDRTGKFKLRNVRAEVFWTLMERLDPEQGDGLMLPPGRQVKKELAAYRWKMTPSGVLIEDKAEMKKRLGASPDHGDAIGYALWQGAKPGMLI